MTPLLFATNNHHKIEELQAAVGPSIQIVGLTQAGIHIDIAEPHSTIQENASEKSSVIHALTGQNCFSEDTGLEVFALGGEPGVKSARYAGTGSSEDNINLLLEKMKGKQERQAQFRTVISLIWKGNEYIFEGICKGFITHERNGVGGFGYDPVFMPEKSSKSFAQMTLDEKNTFSHRKKAADQLVLFLQQHA